MKKITLVFSLLLVAVFGFGQALSGTYKVGVSETAPNFTSLNDAVNALNTNGLAGDVVLEITSDITEAANIGLGVNTSGHSITIRPDADENRTITFTKTTDNAGPSGHFVIGFLGSALTVGWSDAATISTDNVTVDGFAVGGTTRRLKFTTASGSLAASRLIMVIGGCQNTTVKNCILESKSTAASALCFGTIARKGTAIEVAPNGVLLENNVITSVASGTGQGLMTSSSGTLTTAKTTGLVVKNNIISAQGRGGWFYYINGGVFDGNEIRMNQLGNANTVNYGLWTGTGTTGAFVIRNNKIIELTTKEATASGTFGIRALSLGSGASYSVYNNTFAGIDRKGATAATVNQTYVFFGGTGYIHNNTFYMPPLMQTTTPGYYNAIQLSSANPEIKNNIFISDEDAVVNAFYSAVSSGAVENNIYYNRAGNTKSLFVAGTTQNTMALYQSANPTKDILSKNVNVIFADEATGDLSIAGTSVQDANLKVPTLALVPTDIFGKVRDTEYTYAGAHESTLPFLTVEVEEVVAGTIRIKQLYYGIEVELNETSDIELYNINGMLIDRVRTDGVYSRELGKGMFIIRVNGQAQKFVR